MVLERIWADIRRGQNLDLYPTVVISLVVFTLSVLNVVSDPIPRVVPLS